MRQDNKFCDSITLCVHVCRRDSLSKERGMFPSIPACFPAPIVPFVLYYLRSVTHLLQRIGNSRQGRAEQPASIVFLGATVCSQNGWSSLSPASVCFCSRGWQLQRKVLENLKLFEWNCQDQTGNALYLQGCVAGNCFPFLFVSNTCQFGLISSASVCLCFSQSYSQIAFPFPFLHKCYSIYSFLSGIQHMSFLGWYSFNTSDFNWFFQDWQQNLKFLCQESDYLLLPVFSVCFLDQTYSKYLYATAVAKFSLCFLHLCCTCSLVFGWFQVCFYLPHDSWKAKLIVSDPECCSSQSGGVFFA